jgi:hypothetical protein
MPVPPPEHPVAFLLTYALPVSSPALLPLFFAVALVVAGLLAVPRAVLLVDNAVDMPPVVADKPHKDGVVVVERYKRCIGFLRSPLVLV